MNYMIVNADNQPVSFGTVVADPPPDGLTAVELSPLDTERVKAGWQWDPASTTFVEPITAPDPPAVDPLAAVMELLAQVTPDQLARVLALGVAVTEPESVDRLTTAVETGDLADGVAVVAEAAVTAQVSVEGV